jgi:hypothetical protein
MMIFCPRNTRKARKYSNSCHDSIDTKMTLSLECGLRLFWQAKLALPSRTANRVGRNKPIRATARIGVSGKHPVTHGLVPKLQLGNPVREALSNRSCVALPRQLLLALLYLLHPCSRPASMQIVASRTEREARASKTAFPSWSLGTSVTQ